MKNFFIGIIIGIANVIPGVSGGTLAVSFNIFDRLIAIISRFRTKIKEELPFIATLGLGMGVGILAFSKLVQLALENYPVTTNFFFLGVILGSIPMIYKKAVDQKFEPKITIPFAAGLLIMVLSAILVPNEDANVVQTKFSLLLMFKMMIYGVIASVCMIIPGISGSFVLMFIGAYQTVITAVSTLNFPLLIPLGVGIVVGIVGCAKVINRLLYKYGNYTYACILGFVLGSLLVVYPGYSFNKDGILPFVVLVIGFVMTYYSNAKEA